jgi:diguanylate cyclase (GGDEF)-like protein
MSVQGVPSIHIFGKFVVKNPRNLWRRYVAGVTLLLILLIGGHVANTQKLQIGITNAKIINLSGRQRMLSQRMAMAAVLIHSAEPSEKYAKLLSDALGAFTSAHLFLLENATSIPRAKALYNAGAASGLDATVARYVTDLQRVLTLPRHHPDVPQILGQIEAAALGPLLLELDAAVAIFVMHSPLELSNIETVLKFQLALATFLIALEGVLIFWPAQLSVNRALLRVEKRSAQLEERNAQLQILSERLEHSAFHDQLTGLPNRKKLHIFLERMLEDRRIDVSGLCVMHIDLDRFKQVNDTLGHSVGDAVLQRVAEAMQSKMRSGDLVARVGGDEFVVVARLHGANPEGRAQRIAEGLIARIRTPTVIEGNTCTVGASIGYVLPDQDMKCPDDLFRNADIALYEAKRVGKGVAIRFDKSMRSGMERRHALAQDIERGVDQESFVPYFQPKVALGNGRLLGFEVLARWDHPERGVLLPLDFIEIAEEIGILEEIESQIMLKSLDALVMLRHDGWSVPGMAINASGSSLRRQDYAADLKMALAMRHLGPADLTIEVRETTLLQDSDDKALSTLRALCADGFRIEIDDFGTGYASLSMLATLDLSGLKIDRSLIADLENQRSRQVIEAVIGLGKSMGLQILAEGVEHPHQYATLQQFGCDAIQGFGVGHPMPFSAIAPWIEEYGKCPELALGSGPRAAVGSLAHRRGSAAGAKMGRHGDA